MSIYFLLSCFEIVLYNKGYVKSTYLFNSNRLNISPCLCSKKRYLQFYGNPTIRLFQDANSEFSQVISPYIPVNYAKLSSGEFGVIYRREFNNKFGWGVGIGSRFDNYSVNVGIIDFYTENGYEYREVIDAYFINLYVNKTNLRFHFSYGLTEWLGIGLNLNVYSANVSSPNFSGDVSYGIASNSLIITSDTSWKEFNYAYNLDIKMRRGSISIVPELFVTTKIFKGFNFVSGVKMGFFGKNSRYFDIQIEGSFRPESGINQREMLHESAITARDLGYFMGFTYDLSLKRKK